MKILGMGLPELLMVLLLAGVLILIVVLVLRRSNRKKQQAPEAPCQQDGSPEALDSPQAPVLDGWKTSVGFSVLGAVVGFPLAMLLAILLASSVALGAASGIGSSAGMPGEVTSAFATALVTPVAAIFFYVLTIVYATVFYPSYFGSKPKLRSNRAISFLNLTFGFVVFGALWNGGLTKKTKGSSHIVLVVLTALMLAVMAFNIGASVVQGLSYSEQAAPNEGRADEEQAAQEGPSSSVRFHDDTSIAEQVSNDPSLKIYKDNESGAVFQVPASWTEHQLEKDQSSADIVFYIGEAGSEEAAVGYGSLDLWNECSAEERAGRKPSELNADYYGKPGLAAVLGCQESELKEAAYGANAYYRYVPSRQEASTEEALMFCIDNGYLYSLQYQGASERYGDFEAFAASLSF